jgi:Holliday junction resolvase
MAQTPEVKVKNRVKKILDEAGAYYFMPPANGFGRAGIPDIVGCHKGVFFAVECKAGKNIPTALQEREIRNIKNVGGYAWVINEANVEELSLLLGGMTVPSNTSIEMRGTTL